MNTGSLVLRKKQKSWHLYALETTERSLYFNSSTYNGRCFQRKTISILGDFKLKGKRIGIKIEPLLLT